jgi:hypothetical protein
MIGNKIAKDWIDLAENMDQWKSFVNTVKSLRVQYNFGLSLTEVAASEERTHHEDSFFLSRHRIK